MARTRIQQLDYLKGIFILLMVTFHLQLIELTYPVLCRAVYTFHMSAFLIISGYLANVEKPAPAFGKSLLRLVIPYLLFEALYILIQYFVGSSLGTHNAITQLSISDFFYRLATLPTGPYWYIHTLIICAVVYWLVFRLLKLKGISGLAIAGLILFGLSIIIEGLYWSNIIYFLIGMAIFRSGNKLLSVISPSWFALLPLVVLFWFPENYDNGCLAGIAITVLVMSLLLAIYPHCPEIIRRTLTYLGRNSLAIVIFSPIFTIVTKKFAPLFSFDPTAGCFFLIAITFVIGGCLVCAWLSDKMNLSRFIFMKEQFYSPYSLDKQD